MASNAVSMLGLVRIPAAPLPAASCAQHRFNAPGPLPAVALGSLGRKAAAAPGEPLRHRLSNKSRLVASGYDYDAEPVLPSGASDAAQDAGEYIKGAATAVAEEVSGVKELKLSLVDSFYGTQRGLRASSDTRAEIVELISQLEARNPTPAPTEALSLLDGKWILAYTSFSELFPLLAAGSLPLVQVGEISQTIDSSALTVQNSVTFTGPLATTSFSASASFEVRSPKRVQIKFEEGIIGTPQLTDAIEIPESVEVLGRKIELAPIRSILTPLQDAATTIAKTVSGQPPLKFSLSRAESQSWLLTTFLDEDLRISKGDAGSVFVLIKEGSPLLL